MSVVLNAEGRRPGQAGFALVLAILALMLLTFLGLTLAVTSSTELQIATNYRWSQQAYYNAEAGLETAKVLMAQIANAGGSWTAIVPPGRGGPWIPGSAPAVTGWTGAGRDFDKQSCDNKARMGYGVVLQSPIGTRWENSSAWGGQTLNGAFTIWVRRELLSAPLGFSEDTAANPTSLVVTSEGVAPYTGAATAFTRTNQAVRVLELTYSLATGGCESGYVQEGGSQFGDNFNPCARVSEGPGGSLAASLGAGAAGRVGGVGGLTRK